MPEFKVARTGESEAEFRQFLAYLFSGPGVLSGLRVAQTTTASASVTVGAGMANVVQSTLAGSEPLINNSTKTLDVLTANPLGGVPRNDIVAFDAATESIRAIIGTPNAVPTDPTIPASAVALARLRHAGSATSIPSSAIDDLRFITTLAGGFSEPPQSGTVSLAGNATDQRFADVTFARAFSGTPIVFMQGLTGQTSSGTTWNIWPSNQSTTGFRANGIRNNSTTMTVQWLAFRI